MTTGLVATIGAFLLLLTSSSEKLKAFFLKIQCFWLEQITVDKSATGPILYYCLNNYKLSKIRKKIYFGFKQDVEDKTLLMELFTQNTVVFWNGWTPIIISPGRWLIDPVTNYCERSINIYLPRLRKNKDFVRIAVQYYDKKNINKKNKHYIKFFHGKNKNAPTINIDETKRSDQLPSHLEEIKNGKALLVNAELSELDDNCFEDPFDWYIFPQEVMEAVNHARKWKNNRKWYKNKKIPWRRGWLIFGPPGSGKTLLLKCLAQDLDLPVFVFDLASMSNEEYMSFWQKCMTESPCMILFEDFDSVFNKRKNISNDNLSFDCIINSISGIDSSDGLFLGITTNNIQQIDESLGIITKNGLCSRPGRIDEIIELKDMEEDCRRKTAQNILGNNHKDINWIIAEGDGMTAAQFTELCNKIVLSKVNQYDTSCPL